jgi:hypothetical protein
VRLGVSFQGIRNQWSYTSSSVLFYSWQNTLRFSTDSWLLVAGCWTSWHRGKILREKNSIVAQRLLNLCRQAHVIEGGWAAVNSVLLEEADDAVLEAGLKLPNGFRLEKHVHNLRAGKTPADTIERELIPYGGAMEVAVRAAKISGADFKELVTALDRFKPDEEHLEGIKNLTFVQSFGENWLTDVREALATKPDLVAKWERVYQTARAYELWSKAYSIMTPPVSERARAEIQAELSEYETYLPMFGEDGQRLLARLRTFVSSV